MKVLVNKGSWLTEGSWLIRVGFFITIYRKGGFYHEGLG